MSAGTAPGKLHHRLSSGGLLLPLGWHRLRGSLRTVTLGFGTARSPIDRRKGDAPELCRGLDKLHPDFRDARFADGTEIHHAARALFLGHYVADRQQFPHGDGGAQQYQSAVRIYDHGLGVLWRSRLPGSMEGDHNVHAYVDALTPAKITHPPQLWIDGIHGDTSRRRTPSLLCIGRSAGNIRREGRRVRLLAARRDILFGCHLGPVDAVCRKLE